MYKYLSGAKPSGQFHIGNYISTILPILDKKDETLFLVADAHTLTAHNKDIYQNTINLVKILLAFGINNIVIQSQVPEIFELNWILSCYTSKGLLNRAHAYKSLAVENLNKRKDQDKGIYSGLYNYPTLMASDLALFGDEYVMAGQDQKQHIEMANDIVNKFNYEYKTDILKIPEPVVNKNENILGYDGRKMSKSYNNVIPVMCSEKRLRKHIFKVKTNEKGEGESKFYNDSPIFNIYKGFTNEENVSILEKDMKNGISWNDVKERVFVEVNNHFKDAREKVDKMDINDIECLDIGTRERMQKIREKVGFKNV